MKNFKYELFKGCNKIAIYDQERTITYDELYSKANLLGNMMLNRGIGHQDKVGIILSNSIEYVIAIMACIKINAISVIFPYNMNREQFQYMREVAQPNIFITDELQTLLKNANCIYINNTIMEEAKDNIQTTNIKKYELAYIIFTSGSTGMPKGVMISYQALNNYVEETISKMDITQSSRILVTSLFSFDASLGYIYCMLRSKASLVLLNKKVLLPRLVYGAMKKFQVTHYACTPSFLCNLIKYMKKKGIDELVIKVFSFGAENTYQKELQVIKAFKSKYPQIRLFNRYGPTETTIVVSSCEILNNSEEILSVGEPYKNVEFYILDEEMNIVKEGERGELYIAGIQLMDGYYHDKNLTESVMYSYNGKRVYRTYDLFEYHCTGNVFLGRNDDMLKRDGKRIYLSEIENIISQLTGIKDSTCIIDDTNSNEIVVAYLVVNDEERCLESIKQIKQSYPAYMLPNSFVAVDEIPKTLNGKRNKSIMKYKEKTNEIFTTWN